MRMLLPGGFAAVLVAATAPAAGCGGPERDAAAVNVLLISLDSTRQDLLGAYGRRPAHAPDTSPTPNLDRLAREGVLFEDALATTSWTLPSHASLFTGEPELVHGVDLDGHRLGPDLPTLAEILRRRGYRTAGFFSGPYLEPAFGFDRGFERYEACYGPDLARAAERAAEAAARVAAASEDDPASLRAAITADGEARALVEAASHRDRSSEQVTDAVLDELERAAGDGRPFFLFAHYFDPHYDYTPPPPFDTRFDPDYDGAIDGADFYRNPAVSTFDASAASGRRRVVGERDLEHLVALYEGELAWTDSQIGRVLERLDDLGEAERTLVVVVADHGDEFFEHGGIGHRRTLFEEVLRVPLVLRLPGRLPGGRRIPGPVALTDVAPTVLDLTGVRPPGALRGRSLVPAVDEGRVARGVPGRFVGVSGVTVRVPTERGKVAVRGHMLHVLETYRTGAIKITRARRWPRAAEPTAPDVALALEERAEAMRADEELSWIDLERHPDERAEDRSSDFDDPRARSALDEFRAAYAELLARRRGALVGEPTASLLPALRGLGYVGEEARLGALADDELVLPPPGEGIP